MTRVRGFTQDDAHLFCTEEQVRRRVPRLHRDDAVRAGHAGPERLPRAARLPRPGQRQVRRRRRTTGTGPRTRSKTSARGSSIDYTAEPGEAAFYGPKADFVVTDCIGREWQLGTVQLDYNLPARFELRIHRRGQPPAPAGDDPPRAVRLDGAVHRRPDRALRRGVPALARAGAGPRAHGQREERRLRPRRSKQKLRAAGLRVTGDYRPEKLGAKIRDGQLELIPYMLVVGPRDAESGTRQRPRPHRRRPGRDADRRRPSPASAKRSPSGACARPSAAARRWRGRRRGMSIKVVGMPYV